MHPALEVPRDKRIAEVEDKELTISLIHNLIVGSIRSCNLGFEMAHDGRHQSVANHGGSSPATALNVSIHTTR